MHRPDQRDSSAADSSGRLPGRDLQRFPLTQIRLDQMGDALAVRLGGEDVSLILKLLFQLEEVLDEVGPDACRYFFLARSADAQMDFDLDLAKREAPENPVYYIQYAHARIAGIIRGAREAGLPEAAAGADVSLLSEQAEEQLIREMLRFPEVVQGAARNLEPHHLPHYALSLATAFHDFYTRHRVLESEEGAAVALARLRLVYAARTVLANVLGLGKSKP